MARRGWTIHWNGPPARCVGQSHSRCEAFWRAVRSYHVNTKGWSDIAYSFGVCPHGTRFEGRGWNRGQWANGSDQVGANDGRDSEWYTVLVFLGQGEKPTTPMILGVQALIQQGRDTGRCGMKVLPHLDFKVKTCPGPEFTALARSWDNRAFGTTSTDPATETSEEDVLMAIDPNYRGHARMEMRIFLGRSPKSYEELDFHADEIKRRGLNAYIEWLEQTDEAKAWAKKIGAEVRTPDAS